MLMIYGLAFLAFEVFLFLFFRVDVAVESELHTVRHKIFCRCYQNGNMLNIFIRVMMGFLLQLTLAQRPIANGFMVILL